MTGALLNVVLTKKLGFGKEIVFSSIRDSYIITIFRSWSWVRDESHHGELAIFTDTRRLLVPSDRVLH